MTHEESGLGVIKYSEVVATLNKKNLSKKRVQFTQEKRFKLENIQPLMWQQMKWNNLKKLILIQLLVRVQPEN